MISVEIGFCLSPSDKETPLEGRCHLLHNLQLFLPVLTKLQRKTKSCNIDFDRIVEEMIFSVDIYREVRVRRRVRINSDLINT